jgi:hypothetical protein
MLLLKICQRSEVRRLCGSEKVLDDTTNGPRSGPKPASSIPTKITILVIPPQGASCEASINKQSYKT